jgi:hypothetical protein
VRKQVLNSKWLFLLSSNVRNEQITFVHLQELKQLGSSKAPAMKGLVDSYSKLVADAQKVQYGKGKDKRLLCDEFSATLALTQVAKDSALAGV